MDPEPSPVIRRDRMPARVTLPDGRDLAEARVILTGARIYAWVGGSRGVELVAELEYDREASVAPRGSDALWTVETSEGPVVVQRGSGCGCGSPLRSFVPFSPMRSGS
jgi:hypothetical protein